MFSYYGSKSKVINLYPPPKFDKVIEPFAGSARYSLKYWDRQVYLYDKYDVIVGIWKWLQVCSKKDVLSLRHPGIGNKIIQSDFDCIEQYWMMGFLIARVQRTPARTVTPFGAMRFESDKKRIAENLFKIKHWKINQADYSEIENIPATWFIDSPYQFGGHSYKFGNKKIDFVHLAAWCKSRIGQQIVCENTKANWMHFLPMKDMFGIKHTTTEAFYSNLPTNYDFQQKSLFPA